MAKEVIMPKFGFNQESAEIVTWLKQPGEAVEQGDPLCEVTTDKVNMEVEAPATGILDGVRFAAGAVVPVTEIIAYIRAASETLAGGVPASPAPEEPAREAAPARATPVARRVAEQQGVDLAYVEARAGDGRIRRQDVEAYLAAAGHTANGQPAAGKPRAVPAARRVARELGIDLAGIAGSGPRGRVQSADVLAEHARRARAAEPAPQPAAVPSAPAPSNGVAPGVLRAIPLAGMRRTIATRLQRSAQEAPHIYFEASVDMTAAEALRARANQHIPAGQPRVSATAIIARVCAWALKRHPLVNSRLEGDQILLMADVHIGIAVALEEGLIVPVARDVDRKGLIQLGAEIADLAERARAGRLRPEEVQDGTFTISNLGMFGVDRFTAIINPPQCAILAVGRVEKRFVPDERDQPALRPMLSLTLSADHRAIDGAVAARFLGDVRAGLEQPELLVL